MSLTRTVGTALTPALGTAKSIRTGLVSPVSASEDKGGPNAQGRWRRCRPHRDALTEERPRDAAGRDLPSHDRGDHGQPRADPDLDRGDRREADRLERADEALHGAGGLARRQLLARAVRGQPR